MLQEQVLGVDYNDIIGISLITFQIAMTFDQEWPDVSARYGCVYETSISTNEWKGVDCISYRHN